MGRADLLQIVGGIVVLVGIVLSITSSLLVALRHRGKHQETRRILEQVRAAGVIPKDAQI